MKRRLPSPLRHAPVRRFLTIADWLPTYTKHSFFKDLQAGLTVSIILVPQAMAYALLAGMPPIYGLYASIVPLLVYPLFGTSKHIALGVTAIDALIIAAGASILAEPMSANYIALVILLAFITGLIQIALGVFRLGFVVNLLSGPVITGFMAAAALIISISQLKNIMGLTIARSDSIFGTIADLVEHIGQTHALTLFLGCSAVFLLVVLHRFLPKAPSPLIVVVAATLVTWFLRLDESGVAVVGDIAGTLPSFKGLDLSVDSFQSLLPTAVTLALVQFMSVMSLGKMYASKHRYVLKPNRELVSVGLANTVGSFFQSMPVSASFARTAVNERAGSNTPASNTFAALAVALVLLFMTGLLYYLPIAILGAIIIVAVLSLVDVERVKFLFHVKRGDGLIAVVTFLATLLIGITAGVGAGIVGSVIAIMYRISNPNVVELGRLPGTRSFRSLAHYPEAERIDGIVILRMDASFSFVNADLLRDVLLEYSVREHVRDIVIDASSINDLDTSAAATLASAARTLRERDIEIYFGGVKDPVLQTMKLTGLTKLVGSDHFFLSPYRAIQSILEDRDNVKSDSDIGGNDVVNAAS